MNRHQQIQSVLEHSTIEHYTQGKVWYWEAHNYAKQLSQQFNLSLQVVCGIIAALSPLKEWGLNMRIAKQFIEGKRNVHTKLQVLKAESILEGRDIEKSLGGLKTVNFHFNLLNPPDPNWLTLDRHMFWMFKTKPCLTPKQYNKLKTETINYATETGWIPSELQATLWLTVKDIKHDL